MDDADASNDTGAASPESIGLRWWSEGERKMMHVS